MGEFSLPVSPPMGECQVWGRGVHSKKFLYGKLNICSLYGRHLQICFSKLSICCVQKHMGPIQMNNIKIIICCIVYLAQGGETGLCFAGGGLDVQN